MKFIFAIIFLAGATAQAFDYQDFLTRTPIPLMEYDESNTMDSGDYNPFDVNIEETLLQWDAEMQTAGLMTRTFDADENFSPRKNYCFEKSCAVWVVVRRSTQTLDLYVDGVKEDSWLVSTGAKGHGTPNFSIHPDGRIFDKYSSKKYPGGDYKGLGNMPYAVFIKGGFALHGTPKANWPMLGKKASHGCIRMHPDNGYIFNRLVREVGVKDTWITVKE